MLHDKGIRGFPSRKMLRHELIESVDRNELVSGLHSKKEEVALKKCPAKKRGILYLSVVMGITRRLHIF